jgi:hypothetical protein
LNNKLSLSSVILAGLLVAGCNTTPETAVAGSNANSGQTVATTTRPGPDNSEITTSTDANGVRTETRVFRGNPRVTKVVVTTRNGVRTTRIYSSKGEEKELSSTDSRNALEETGDAVADAAGFVADKTVEGAEKAVEVGKTAAEKTADTTKTVADKTADGAKKVGEKTADGAKKVGEKTAEGAKKVGEKTAEGAKKAGKAIKRAVTP